MWPNLKIEIADRFFSARRYFTAVAGGRGSATNPPIPSHVVTAKGLLFVQLYAVYEYTVRELVRLAITEINGHRTSHKDVRLELLPLIFDNHLQSITTCGVESRWAKRIDMFTMVNSDDHVCASVDLFPHDGSHYRIKQLYTIWELFGIDAPVIPHARLTDRISELVENRNAIAHGRRTAEDVGSSLSRDDMHDRIDATELICNHIVTTMELHCSNPANYAR